MRCFNVEGCDGDVSLVSIGESVFGSSAGAAPLAMRNLLFLSDFQCLVACASGDTGLPAVPRRERGRVPN
jgi:hypothetical protein